MTLPVQTAAIMIGSIATGYVVDGLTLIPLGAVVGTLLVVVRLTYRWAEMEVKIESLCDKVDDKLNSLETRIERLERHVVECSVKGKKL